MDANLFFEEVSNVKPDSTWSVTTTKCGVHLEWEWDSHKIDGHKTHDYIIPAEAMKDDELVRKHLEICRQKISEKK